MGSSIIDYFTSGISNTYNQTVDYWSKEDSAFDAVDTVVWSVQNTDTVAEAASQGIDNSVKEFKRAAQQDAYKLAGIVVIALGSYMYLNKKGYL